MRHSVPGIALVIGIVGVARPLAAKVVKFEILRTESPAFEGRSFGAVGTYDRIIARATIAVSPSGPHNSMIVDIDHAPRNAQGLVEAVSDVEILRPTIAASGNRELLYEVANRGNKLGPPLFNDTAIINDPIKAADLLAGSGRVTFTPPTVPQVTGLSREEFIFDHLENPAGATLSYPAADLEADPRVT